MKTPLDAGQGALGRGVAGVTAWLVHHEVALLMAAAPVFLFPGPWTAAGVAAVVLLWLARLVATGRPTLPTPMDGALALLFGMALVGWTVSPDPSMSQAKFWGLFLQVALFFGVANGLRTERHLQRMAGLLIGLTVAVAVVSLVGTDWESARLLQLPALYRWLPRLIRGVPGSGVPVASDLFHPREVGATLAMLLPIALALLLFGRHRPLRWLSLLALVAGGFVLLLSESLQAAAGLAVAVLLIAAWRSRWFLLALPLGALGLVAALLAYGPQRAAVSLLSLDHPIGVGVVLRWDIWSRAWAMVSDMPFTGVGLNTYPLVQSHFYPGFLLGPEVHAHNLFLQTAVDLGWPGVVALLWLLGAFYVVAVRAYRVTAEGDLRVLLVGVVAGATAYVVHGLVDTMTLGAKPVAALFVMFGVAAALYRRGQRHADATPRTMPERRPRQPLVRRVVPVLLVLVLLAAPWLVNPAAPLVNRGMVRAHKVLLAARTTGSFSPAALEAALVPLRHAAERAPENVYVQQRLGSLYAWQGDDAAAVASIARRVALDAAEDEPLARYAPFEVARWHLQGETGQDPWDGLLRVYRYWNNRYPKRAEGYVRQALVWAQYKSDLARAQALVQSGLDAGAEPTGLLTYYASQLEASR